MRPTLALFAVPVALVAVVLPRLAAAQEQPSEPVPAERRFAVDPEEAGARTNTTAGVAGITLIAAGAVQIPIGVAVFASAQRVFCNVPAGGGFGGGCGDGGFAAKQRVGATLIGIGSAAVAVGVPLTIWGFSRKTPADVRVGLGSVSTTFRF